MASQGGYDCEFVDGPPKDLHSECSICLMVLRQPYLVDCCGHHFCKACLEGVSEGKKVCPLCKHESFTAIPNKGLERVLNEKNVYCTNMKAGCDWSGELRQLDSHLNVNGESLAVASLAGKNTSSPRQQVKVKLDVCQFVEVRCQNCPVMVKRIEIKKHLDECPNRPIQCKYCKSHTATPQDLVEKHQLVCPKFPVSCPNKCGASIQRRNVTKHVDTTCPLSKLQCEYSHVGCTVVMSRKKMDAHLKSASGMAEHLSLMDKAYSDLKKSKSEKKVEDEEKDELRTEVECLESELVLMEESYQSQQSQLASLGQRNVALEKEIRRQRNAIEQLTSENRNLAAKLDKYSSNYYDADVYYSGVGERPRHKSTRPSPAGTRDYGSLELDKPTRKSSGSRKKSADSDETDGIGWGTALSLAAGIGLGVVGAAGVAAMASQSSSDKDKKSKNNSWF